MNELALGELLLDKKKKSFWSVILYVLIAILIALILFFYFVGCVIIDGESMCDTLQDDQRVLLQKHGATIERGDIVTFTLNDNGEQKMLIKRVIALGGDRVLFVTTENSIYVDLYIMKDGDSTFKLVNEPYIKEKMFNGTEFRNVTVMPYVDRETIESTDKNSPQAQQFIDSSLGIENGYFFFLGDNRNHSSDAREFGPSAVSDITGKVLKIVPRGGALEGFVDFMFSL